MKGNILNINSGEIIRVGPTVMDALLDNNIIRWYNEYDMYGFKNEDEDEVKRCLKIIKTYLKR